MEGREEEKGNKERGEVILRRIDGIGKIRNNGGDN
jgi:hypothetical protein